MSDARATVEIVNSQGLHVRTSSILAKTAIRFLSKITIAYGNEVADARSAIELVALGAGLGARLQITALGPDAADAVAAISKLFEEKFGDE